MRFIYLPVVSGAHAGALSDERLAAASANVGRAIDDIRAVMRQAGYADGDYRLVLQTYPVVISRAGDARYAELDPQRTSTAARSTTPT